jgi:hypothetical protein
VLEGTSKVRTHVTVPHREAKQHKSQEKAKEEEGTDETLSKKGGKPLWPRKVQKRGAEEEKVLKRRKARREINRTEKEGTDETLSNLSDREKCKSVGAEEEKVPKRRKGPEGEPT